MGISISTLLNYSITRSFKTTIQGIVERTENFSLHKIKSVRDGRKRIPVRAKFWVKYHLAIGRVYDNFRNFLVGNIV